MGVFPRIFSYPCLEGVQRSKGYYRPREGFPRKISPTFPYMYPGIVLTEGETFLRDMILSPRSSVIIMSHDFFKS